MFSKFIKLIASIALCLSAGFIGSIFTRESVQTWYQTLNKPSFNPPDWLFAPVWTALFILMGIALYLIWQSGWRRGQVKAAMILFVIHLGFNLLWSLIFFAWQNPQWAFIEIMFLWLLIVFLIALFSRIRKPAAYLLVPYLLWVSFAAVLNYQLWRLN